jgi:NitT/TauT family transport system ATP-binding protein
VRQNHSVARSCGPAAAQRGTIRFSGELYGATPSWGLLVRQENSLFPWMTALENAAFGLEMLGVPRIERERAARELLRRHGLGGRERAYPRELSAGMKQRVAVIRAFLADPPLLLMDEPFGALDSQTRARLQKALLELWSAARKSVLFVTHDVDEALLLSDRIVVLSGQPGKVLADVTVPLARDDRGKQEWDEAYLALRRRLLSLIEVSGSLEA